MLHFLIGEQAKILHYMAKHTGGQYFSAPPSGYADVLEAILVQLHFRYELGFVPAAIDGKRHELTVELTKEARSVGVLSGLAELGRRMGCRAGRLRSAAHAKANVV